MTQPISAGRLALLKLIVKHPGLTQDKLLSIPGVGTADLDYLVTLDLVRQREAGRFHATHLGEKLVRRGL